METQMTTGETYKSLRAIADRYGYGYAFDETPLFEDEGESQDAPAHLRACVSAALAAMDHHAAPTSESMLRGAANEAMRDVEHGRQTLTDVLDWFAEAYEDLSHYDELSDDEAEQCAESLFLGHNDGARRTIAARTTNG